jgi:L,D-transpeptidase catalytic domain
MRAVGPLYTRQFPALRACAAFAAAALAAGCGQASSSDPSGGSPPIAAVPPTLETPARAAETAAIPAPAAVAPGGADPAPAAPAKEPEAGPRIYAKARFAWIQAQPRFSNGWIGYLSLGSSLKLRGGSVEAARIGAGGGGCNAWYAVEPRGYVCEGDAATVDANDPAVRALAADAPKVDSPWPWEYGESIGAPRYPHLPTALEQRQTEWDLDAHQKRVAAARGGDADKAMAGVDLAPAGVPAPDLYAFSPLVREGRPWIAPGSTVAYTRSFDAEGRTWLLTHDKALIPKDRVKPYPHSTFHGVEIGGETALPIAFFRRTDRPKYKRTDAGAFEKTGESFARLSSVGLTGEQIASGAQTFLATREPGIYVLADDASVAAVADPPAAIKASTQGRRTWLDISVMGGTLVAYEGEKPVFATLIAPGRGGVPVDGRDPLETASTPTGTFRVDGKFVTATMVSSTNDLIVHTEVQFVQNFHGPHALHGAYWHDAWGERKSGGCVNLSPMDSKRVFGFTEPELPEGWYGIRSTPEAGGATVVVVHK